MWIGEANYELLVKKTVGNLLDSNSGVSYTLVVPPGFGESYVPAEIAKQLAASETNPLVAELKLDSIRSVKDFCRAIDDQWSGKRSESEFGSLGEVLNKHKSCLLYTSPSPRDQRGSRMPSSA